MSKEEERVSKLALEGILVCSAGVVGLVTQVSYSYIVGKLLTGWTQESTIQIL